MINRYPTPIAQTLFSQPQLPDGEQYKPLYSDFLDVLNIYLQQILLTYSVTPSDYKAMNSAYIDFFINYFNLADLRLTETGYTEYQITTIISNATIIYNTQGSYYCLRYFFQVLQGYFDDNIETAIFNYDGAKEFDGSFVFGFNNLNVNVPISYVNGTFIINVTSEVNDLVLKLLEKFKSARDKIVQI